MPISHKHRCIFVHIPKTGGTSVEQALGIGKIDHDAMRSHDIEIFDKISYAPQHFTASMLKEHEKIKEHWFDYYRFSIVRNPYERVLSEFFWHKYGTSKLVRFNHMLFKEFLNNYFEAIDTDHKIPQTSFIYDENHELMVDKVFRFEEIKEIGEYLSKELGTIVKIPKIQTSGNKKRYLENLDADDKHIIQAIYAKDFELLRYPL